MPDHLTESECPACGWPIEIVTRHGDQLVRCPDCQGFWWAEYDVDGGGEIGMPATWRGGYRLTPAEPERCDHSPGAWRSCSRCSDADGDLRQHGAL